MPPLHLVPDFGKICLKLVFGIYLLVTLIVSVEVLSYLKCFKFNMNGISKSLPCLSYVIPIDRFFVYQLSLNPSAFTYQIQVLINLLIAMMSDTYQRIQAQSDKVNFLNAQMYTFAFFCFFLGMVLLRTYDLLKKCKRRQKTFQQAIEPHRPYLIFNFSPNKYEVQSLAPN